MFVVSAAALGVTSPFSARTRHAPRMAASTTPNGVFNTANYREAEALSQRLVDLSRNSKPQRGQLQAYVALLQDGVNVKRGWNF